MLCVVILGCRCPATHREEGDTFDYKKMTLDVLPNFLQLLPKITIQRTGTPSCPLHISLEPCFVSVTSSTQESVMKVF